jgi:uncharacterized protein YjbI with pentapeptide repeats
MIGPDAHQLEPASASDVEAEDVREAEEIVGEHLAHLGWTRVSLRECHVHLTDVAEVVLDQARLIDSRLTEPDITQVAGADSTWRSVAVDGGRIGAWDLAGGVLDAVTVAGAQLGYVNLRDATLTDVVMHDCRIGTLDLAGAKARRVSLAGCVIGELVVVHADLDEVDLRGARIDRVDGVESLGGAIISAEQLLDLAPALAQAAGMTIGPWPV